MPPADGQHHHTTTTEIAALVAVAGGTLAVASQTDHVAPILTFVGALIVVVITAVTTNRRQDRSIAADHGRQEQALAFESERHAAQLRHDRELADLADLRKLLDEAAVALQRADFIRADVIRGVIRKLDDEWLEERREPLNAGGRAVHGIAARLAVRLTDGERVVQTFRAADEALQTFTRRTGYLVQGRTDFLGELGDFNADEARNEITAASDDFERHVTEFHAAAVERTRADRDT